jgi:hypothetical protein
MTRDDYARTLRMMEHARELAYEATGREKRRLIADYNRMERAIRPYALGKRQFSDVPSEQAGSH